MPPTRASARATALVALVSLAAYLPALANGFAFDDVRDITENPAVVDATGPAAVLTSPYRGDVPPSRSPYRPISSVANWLNWVTTGDAPLPFHVVNVVLHVLATVLVVRLLGALGTAPIGIVLGGLAFAVHPVHVEAVANVVGRADVLMTIFCLVGALAFLRRGLPTAARAALVAAAYALALGSKENGVALPALLASTMVLPRERVSRADESVPDQVTGVSDGATPLHRDLIVLAPTLLVLAAYLAVRHSVLGTLVQRDTAPYIGLLTAHERLPTAVANLVRVVGLLVAPVDLVADYGPDVITVVGVASPRFWAGTVTVLLVAALAGLLYRRQRLGTVAIAWIVLSLVVVSNLVIPIGVWVAERTLYLPSVGISIGVAALVGSTSLRSPSRLRGTWAIGLVLACAGLWKTVDRIPAWASSEAMLSTLAEEHPESYRSQWWLARRLSDVGDAEASLRWYERGRETNPNDLGLALDYTRELLLAGRASDAEAVAAALPPTDPSRFVYLVQSRIMTGRLEEAREDVRAGLVRFPSDARLRGQASRLGVEIPEP